MRLTAISAAIMTALCPASAYAQDGGDFEQRDWRITIGGGVASFGENRDQPYGSVSLRRNFDNFYVSLGGSVVGYDGRDPAAGDTAPASTQQLTLGAGYESDTLALDTYVSIGERDFEKIAITGPGGTPLTFNADGGSWSLGAALTYQFALGGRWYAAPFAAIDYSEISTAQILAAPGGQFVTRDVDEGGVTSSTGATLQYALGEESQHSIGLYSAFVATSNTASTTRIVGTHTATGAPQRLDGVSDGDSWFEYGASASFALSDVIVLDLWLSRTAGLSFGEATSAAVSLSFDF